MQTTQRGALAWLAAGSLAVLAATACNSGGSGDGGGTSQATEPSETTAAVASVPLAGEMVADCSAIGIGVVDTVINTVNGILGDSLPTALPTLSDVIAMANLPDLPVIGGLQDNGSGGLDALGLDVVTDMLPGGVGDLADLPLPGQLPLVCSSIVAFLPPLALTDPAALLAALGDPTAALGVIPLFDVDGNPVGALLATLPAGLNPAGGSGVELPGVPQLPTLGSLDGIDPSTLPIVGSALGSTSGDLLALLNLNGLLSGDLLGLLTSLLGGIL